MQQQETSIAKNNQIQNSNGDLSFVHQEIAYSGSIPHPDILKGLHEINPIYDKMVMDMAFNHANTDDLIKKKTIKFNAFSVILGQIFSFVFGIFGLLLATYLAIKGHTTSAVISAIVVIVQVVVAGISRK